MEIKELLQRLQSLDLTKLNDTELEHRILNAIEHLKLGETILDEEATAYNLIASNAQKRINKRVAAEKMNEQKRLKKEQDQQQKINKQKMDEAEKQRLADEAEKKRLADEAEKQRIADEEAQKKKTENPDAELEEKVRAKLANGKISTSDLKAILGKTPNWDTQQIGKLKLVRVLFVDEYKVG